MAYSVSVAGVQHLGKGVHEASLSISEQLGGSNDPKGWVFALRKDGRLAVDILDRCCYDRLGCNKTYRQAVVTTPIDRRPLVCPAGPLRWHRSGHPI